MVVRFPLQDGEGAVKLLCKNRAHHLVGESHAGERNLVLRAGIDGVGKAIGPAHAEYQVLGPAGKEFLQMVCKFQRAVFVSVLVQEHQYILRAHLPENQLSLLFFNLRLRKGRYFLQLRNFRYLEGYIVPQPGRVQVQTFFDPLDVGLPYGKEHDVHITANVTIRLGICKKADRMNKNLHILVTAAALCVCLLSYGQVQQTRNFAALPQSRPQGEFSVFSSITKYLAAGDEAALSSWFADNLDVTVLSTSRNCSKKQAREILRNFFASNTPRSFEVTHRASETNKKYLIGLLNAGGELFQVTIYATSTGQDTYKIQQLNISRQMAAY